MYLIFLSVSIGIIIISKQSLGRLINPCSMYSIIWIFTVSLYSSGLIIYDNISRSTYVIIILYQVFLCGGILAGDKFKIKVIKDVDESKVKNRNIIYDKFIVITAIISSISILAAFIITIRLYGPKLLLSSISRIYQDREAGLINNFSYFSPMIFVSLVICAIQMRNGHFRWYYIYVVLLSVINAITFGGRNNIVTALIMFGVPYLGNPSSKRKKKVSKRQKKRNKKTQIIVLIIGIIFTIVFYLINMQRSLATIVPSGIISPTMESFVEQNYSIYKVVQYLTEPIAYLNIFLKDPYFKFGANTFNFVIKQLNKIGFELERLETLPFLYVPQLCNVGTYITELVIDFGKVLGLLVVFVFGIILAIFRKKAIINKNDIIYQVFLSIMYVSILLSFFMWYIRTSNTWIILIYGIVVGLIIRNSLNVLRRKKERILL